MSQKENIQDFIAETRDLVREWVEAKIRVYKLSVVKTVSKTAGAMIWILISMFLFTLLVIFTGVTAGYWLSSITGSYVKGFGIVTLVILFLIILVALFRRALFVNPIIRMMISRMTDEKEEEKTND